MDYFKQQYTESEKNIFAGYGFKTYANNSYRIINDVFQSFHLHRSVYGGRATVEFGILPLCTDRRIDKSTCLPWHLKMFEGSMAWFDYDGKSERSIDECIVQIKGYMSKYLVPFFDGGMDCKGAYKVICGFEKAYGENVASQSCDMAWMALKNGDYENVLRHLRGIRAQNTDAYDTNVKSFGEEWG